MEQETKTLLLGAIPSAQSVRKETQENEKYKETMMKLIKSINGQIERAKEKGLTDTCFTCYEYVDDIKKLYREQGYSFKPTGIIGGVYQSTEQICW